MKDDSTNLTTAKNMIEAGWEVILEGLKVGYDLDYKNDVNFKDTPTRNARALLERCVGINSDDMCKGIMKNAKFPSEYKGMIMVSPITVHSLCPHHFENVLYNVSVAYIPTSKCIGLSKIARVVKIMGSQPILQEDYTSKLTDFFYKELKAEGVMVLTIAKHNCMIARGVKQSNNTVRMADLRGSFIYNPAVKAEFYNLLNTNLTED